MCCDCFVPSPYYNRKDTSCSFNKIIDWDKITDSKDHILSLIDSMKIENLDLTDPELLSKIMKNNEKTEENNNET